MPRKHREGIGSDSELSSGGVWGDNYQYCTQNRKYHAPPGMGGIQGSNTYDPTRDGNNGCDVTRTWFVPRGVGGKCSRAVAYEVSIYVAFRPPLTNLPSRSVPS